MTPEEKAEYLAECETHGMSSLSDGLEDDPWEE